MMQTNPINRDTVVEQKYLDCIENRLNRPLDTQAKAMIDENIRNETNLFIL